MRESRRVTMTKTMLKDSLLELMSKKPLAKISIKEICDNADINRTTFYTHYTDQFALCTEIESDAIEKTSDYLKKVTIDSSKIGFLSDYLHYIKENGHLIKTLLHSGCENNFRLRFVEISVAKLMEFDTHTNLSPTDRDYIFRYIFMGAMSIVEKWLDNDFDKPVNELARLIIALVPSITETQKKALSYA